MFSGGLIKLMKRTNISRSVVIFVLFFCIAGIVASCKEQPNETKAFKEPREPITIGAALETLSAPVIIAYEKGYFSDEGLDVTMKYYTIGKLTLEALFAGKVNFAMPAETPIVMNSFKREDFYVIAGFVYYYDDSKIVVRTDRGIRTASDLKGKMIGTTYGTSAHFFLDAYLTSMKVQHKDVKLIDIPQKDLPNALKHGEVDAIAAFEPYAYEAMRDLPGRTIRLPKADLLRETFDLVAMKDFTKNHPETIKKVLRAIDRASTYIQQNKEDSISVLTKKLHMDEKYLYATWNDYKFGLYLDQTLLLTLEDVAQWAITNNLTNKTKVPNYLNFIYFDGLHSVKPKAVRVMR